jgi:hypothetical protein
MERQHWLQVVALIDAVVQEHPGRRFTFSRADIARVYFWAAVHDRPVFWACQSHNWPVDLRPQRLPTPSTMSRRLRRPEMLALIDTLLLHRRRYSRRALLYYVDGKPLVLRNHTRDPDAKKGWASGGFAKGYKLHLISSAPADLRAWDVTPMNANEPRVAQQLVPHAHIQGYLLGDANYDTNPLHTTCRRNGVQLVAPRRHGPGHGLGHRHHDPARLRCIEMLEQSQTGFGPQLHSQRPNIERQFGCYSSAAGGIGTLPPWVRRLQRVRLWVGAKLVLLVLHHQRLKRAK